MRCPHCSRAYDPTGWPECPCHELALDGLAEPAPAPQREPPITDEEVAEMARRAPYGPWLYTGDPTLPF